MIAGLGLGWFFLCCVVSPAPSTGLHPRDAVALGSSEFMSKKRSLGLLDRGRHSAKMVELTNSGVPSEVAVVTKHTTWKRRITHVKATVLTLTLYVLIFKMVLTGQYEGWKWALSVFICYLLEAATCSTRRYLSNSQTPTEFRQYMDKLREAPPNVQWKAESYHYVHKHVHGSKGRGSGHSTSNKVVTYRGSQSLFLQRWKDITNTETAERALTMESPSLAGFVKVTLSKLVVFANEQSFNKYLQQEKSFLALARARDLYMDSSCHIRVDGFYNKILAVRTVLGGSGTGLAKVLWYWVFTLFTLTVPYRIWFSKRCDEVEVTLTKEVTV